MSHVLSANTAGGTRVGPGTARARLGTPGRLNYAEHRSDSNTISNLCTLSAAPKLGSASARASEVSVKTLTLTPPTTHTVLETRAPRNSGAAELRGVTK